MNLFLMRGLIREKRHWGPFVEKVKTAFPNFNVVTPEIPGVGAHCQTLSPRNFDDMIHFIRAQHEDVLSSGPNAILATSLGGMLAKRWSELYPQDFERMILLNTSFKGINPLFKRLRPKSFLTFLRLFATLRVEDRERLVVKMVSNNKSKHPEIIKSWTEIQKSAPVSRLSAVNQIIAALTFAPSSKRPSAKLLLLAAKKDRLCSYECSQKLSELWEAPLRLHPEAGHELPYDDGEWLLEQLKDFLQESSHSYSS